MADDEAPEQVAATIPMDYVDEDVDLAALSRAVGPIRRHRFRGCRLYGPAIIWGANSVLENNIFTEPEEAMYWPVDEDRRLLAGAILLEDSQIYECTLINIGIAVWRSQFNQLLEGISHVDLHQAGDASA